MAVMQLQPDLNESVLANGYRVPRGSSLRSVLGRGDQTACEYRTAHDVTLWPLEIAERRVHRLSWATSASSSFAARPRAALRFTLRATAGLKFSELSLDDLTLFLRGGDDLPIAALRAALRPQVAVVVRPAARPVPWQQVIVDDADRARRLRRRGGAAPLRTALVPGLSAAAGVLRLPGPLSVRQAARAAGRRSSRCDAHEIEILVLSDAHDPGLDGVVNAQHFALHCTPAVNLFPRRADRIHLTESEHEYHVVPDRTRPMDFEVHSVGEVVGFGSSADVKQPFHPFFAWNDLTAEGDAPAYYTVQRQPRALSARQRARGARSSYVGSEVFLSLVDPDEGPYRPILRQLAVETLCTNRDLPLAPVARPGADRLHARVGRAGRVDPLPGGPEPAARVARLRRPQLASHQPPVAQLPVAGRGQRRGGTEGAGLARAAVALRRSDRRRARASRSRASAPPRARGSRGPCRFPGPTTFGRGMEVTLTCDETAFEGSGVFLLGAVLERFFAKYVSINSFTETVLRTDPARRDHAMADESGTSEDPARLRDGGGPWREGARADAVRCAGARRPSEFDFFQALRRLEAAGRPRSSRGSERRPRPADEPIRLGQEPDLTFAASSLARLRGRRGRRAAAAAP